MVSFSSIWIYVSDIWTFSSGQKMEERWNPYPFFSCVVSELSYMIGLISHGSSPTTTSVLTTSICHGGKWAFGALSTVSWGTRVLLPRAIGYSPTSLFKGRCISTVSCIVFWAHSISAMPRSGLGRLWASLYLLVCSGSTHCFSFGCFRWVSGGILQTFHLLTRDTGSFFSYPCRGSSVGIITWLSAWASWRGPGMLLSTCLLDVFTSTWEVFTSRWSFGKQWISWDLMRRDYVFTGTKIGRTMMGHSTLYRWLIHVFQLSTLVVMLWTTPIANHCSQESGKCVPSSAFSIIFLRGGIILWVTNVAMELVEVQVLQDRGSWSHPLHRESGEGRSSVRSHIWQHISTVQKACLQEDPADDAEPSPPLVYPLILHLEEYSILLNIRMATVVLHWIG